MQDNFNMYSWKLKTAINELEETEKIKGKDGKGCWKGYRYAGTENGKDKCVPVKEGEIGLSDILARELFKLQGKISDDLFYKLRKAINSQDPAALAKAKEIMSRIKPEDERIYMGEGEGQCPECGCKMEGQMCNECGYMEEAATFTNKYNDDPKLKGDQKDLPDEVQAKIVAKEGEDHEVSMAQASLKSIISSASELMNKLGDDERDIPGWIQDHITNSENFIDQANQGFHELEPSDNSDEINESRADLRLPEGYYIAKDRFELYPGGRPWRSQFNKGQIIVVRKDETMGVWNDEKKAWVPKTTPESPRVYYKIKDLQGGNIMLQTFLNNTKKISKEEAEKIINSKMNEAMVTSANSNNPEGDALVLRFLQGIAKKYNYPVSHAAMFVKERISKLGY